VKHNCHWIQKYFARAIMVVLVALAIPSSGFATNFLFTAGSSKTAWLTGANWNPGGGPPGPLDVAEFDTTVPSTGDGGSQINFKNAVNNGPTNEAVGAIWVLPTRTSNNLFIGNGSSGTTATNGFLTLNGATINGTNNIVIENDSTGGSDITVTNVGAGGGASVTMGLVLANTTENIVVLNGNSSIGISDILSSSNGLTTPLTFAGLGTKQTTISGTANTFTGSIKVIGAEVDFNGNGSLGNSGNSITIDGGRFAVTTSADVSSHAIFLGGTAGTSVSASGAGTTITYTGVLADKPGATGILVKQGKGILALGGVSTYSGSTSNNNGTIQLTIGNNRLPSGTTLNLGQSASANLGVFDLNGFNQQIAGLNSISGINTNTLKNTVTNSGVTASTLTLGGNGIYAYGDGSTNNSGVIVGNINLVKNGSGTQILGDTNTYTGATTANTGTLALSGTGSIGNSPEITVAAGAIVDVSARNDDTLTLASGQTLDGFGTVTGIVTTLNGSTIATGNSNTIGILTVSSNLNLNGTTTMKLDKADVTNDTLSAGGTVTFGGTLTVTNLSGALVAGDSFQLFNASTYLGSFSAINLPALNAGLAWTNTLAVNGTLGVVTSSAPVSYLAINNITLSGANLLIGGTNQGSGTYYVLASTNVTLPLISWTAIATNVLNGSGNFTLTATNVIDPNAAQEFYILGTTNND
jgi:fibronectin-binding autotransporter adhesin